MTTQPLPLPEMETTAEERRNLRAHLRDTASWAPEAYRHLTDWLPKFLNDFDRLLRERDAAIAGEREAVVKWLAHIKIAEDPDPELLRQSLIDSIKRGEHHPKPGSA